MQPPAVGQMALARHGVRGFPLGWKDGEAGERGGQMSGSGRCAG